MNHFNWKLSFILLLALIACKEDLPIPENASKEEKIYFEDYEAPQNKWGYIDEIGTLVIENIYDDTRDFSEGLAAVNYQGKWGFIDLNGQLIIAHQYRAAYPFSEGIALVQKMDMTYWYIDQKGKELFSTGQTKGSSFNDGYCLLKSELGYFYLNEFADTLNNTPYTKAEPFINGLAIVKSDSRSYLINNKNEIEAEGLNFISFSENFIRFKDDQGYGYLSLTSEEKTTENRYDHNTNYHNGVAAVLKGKEWYLINQNGKLLTSSYASITYAYENIWIYQQNSKMGLIKSNGEILTSPVYQIIYPFSDQLAAFAVDDQWGYLDIEGNEVIAAMYPLAWSFVNGFARVIHNGRIGFIDKKGNFIIPPQFIEVRDFYEELARVQVYQ